MKPDDLSFRAALPQISGLPFIYEKLPLHSPLGREKLLISHFSTNRAALELEGGVIRQWMDLLEDPIHRSSMETLSGILSSFQDLTATFSNLEEGVILDDIQLFEIKKFVILIEDLSRMLGIVGFTSRPPHPLREAADLLDPEQNRIPHFYIYPQYSPRLEELRTAYSREQEARKKEELWIEIAQLEDQVREMLSTTLAPFSKKLRENAAHVAALDLSLAKAKLALDLELVRPEIDADETRLQGLFHPEARSLLRSQSKHFQAIDIAFSSGPVLITGANMSGKTLILKSIALAQTLFQFGFYVPARKASFKIVDEIMLSINGQDRLEEGLSSFAVEILLVNGMIQKVKQGFKILALVDELARTTNPEEGKRLVKAFLEIMREHGAPAIVTTHYAGIDAPARRLRVKGLRNDVPGKITPTSLNSHIDYGLEEIDSDDVPEEALRIAAILGVDEELLRRASRG